MKLKTLMPALFTLALALLSSCKTLDVAEKNGQPLTPQNSVLLYGYIKDLDEIDFINQSPTFEYEHIETFVDDGYFVAKKPVSTVAHIKIHNYQKEKRVLGRTYERVNYLNGINGIDRTINEPRIYFFCVPQIEEQNKSKEKNALEFALKYYKKTEWAELLNKRLGELQ